ncbi:MAG: KdsC family phosphatase [Limisphaerales bacterium]
MNLSGSDLAADVAARAAKIRLLLCDVDGILTDGTVSVGPGGESKRFHVRDGLGLALWRRAGFKAGWISARPSPATTLRAEELQVDFLVQQREPKASVIEGLLKRHGFAWEETAYLGDDLVDLGPLRRAGLAMTVPEAHPEALRLAHHVTRLAGGHGAVREVIELLLRAHGKWDAILAEALA